MATEGTRKRRRRNTKSTAAATASTSTTATSAEGVSAPPTATAQSPLPTQPTQSTQPSQPQRKRPRSSPANTEQSLPSPPPAPLPEEKDDEEKALESFLFGGMLHADELPFGEEEATERADGQAAAVSGGGGGDVESLFVIDRKGASAVSDTTTTTSSAAVADGDSSVPVWHDPDDQQQMIDLAAQPRLRKLRTSDSEQRITAADYQQRLRQTYTNLNHAASWVKAKRATADTQHDEAMWDVLRTSRSIRQRDTAALPSGHLDIQALKDANAQQPAQVSCYIQSIAMFCVLLFVLRCDDSTLFFNFRSTDNSDDEQQSSLSAHTHTDTPLTYHTRHSHRCFLPPLCCAAVRVSSTRSSSIPLLPC